MSDQGRQLVKEIHRQAIEEYRAAKAEELALVKQVHRAAIEQARGEPLPRPEPATIHWSELPEDKGSPIAAEWNFYRREAGRLLAEGHEGRFLLIKGEEIIGIWDTEEEAKEMALQKFLMQPCLIHQILSREPQLRGPSVLWRWQS